MASWSYNTYIVKFLVDGASYHRVEVDHGDLVYLPEEPKKLGKTFVEWQLNGEKYDESQPVKMNLELVAMFELEKYKITYIMPEGSWDNPNPTEYTVDDEFELQDPTGALIDGYTFKWYLVPDDLSGKLEEITKIEKGTTGNLTIELKIVPIQYTITYENLKDHEHTNPTSYNIKTPDIILTNPKPIEGYQFIGWYDAEVGGQKVTVIAQGSMGDVTLYARFELTEYTIEYVVEGNIPHDNPLTYNIETETFKLNPPKQTEGPKFVGWFMEVDGQFVEVTEILKGTTGNLVLVARFEDVIDPPVNPEE